MKILITDDHSVVRQGYASVLSTVIDDCVVLEASDSDEAYKQFLSESPDLVIMDINLPGVSGIEAATRIISLDSTAKILFFSMYDEAPVVKQALDAGAMGYITKTGSPKVLLEAVSKIAAGEIFIEYELIMKLALNNQNLSDGGLKDLTQREFEVFILLARGNSNQVVAETLNLSVKTISNYVTIIKSKLNISSTAELVHIAANAGIIKFIT